MPAPPQPARDRTSINLQWLVRLRWGAVLGQLGVIFAVQAFMDIELPVVALVATVGVELASNVVLALWARGRPKVHEGVIAGAIAFDVLLLTVLLYFSGGAFNPFNFLYLVHLALAAVILPARWTWSLMVLSAVSFGALFTDTFGPGESDHHMHHADQMAMHLQGMWVAYAVAAVFIIYFVQRITQALAERDEELARARERSARSERLASLATLAAGAAHELSTPLSTIALVASELRTAIAKGRQDQLDEDLTLIQGEVTRCRAILEQMSTDAGDSPGEAPDRLTIATLAQEVKDDVQRPNPVTLTLPEDADETLQVPRRATVRALRGLVDNACDASPASEPVELAIERRPGGFAFVVRDRGAGMPPEVLERAGEPFFTTKEPGKGMGLGLFLARAIAEQLGGSLDLRSDPERGTTAALFIPATNDHLPGAAVGAEE